MTDRIKNLYAVYNGKTRIFPKGEVLETKTVYEIDIIPPGENFRHYMVEARIPNWWTIYLPYMSGADIWEEWTPYGGTVIDK